MNKTKIDWADYTWNPVVGCRNGCWYCYAKSLFERFHPGEHFKYFHIYPERFKDPDLEIKKPQKIFVGSMTDLMDPGIPIEIIKKIFNITQEHPWHTFIFLTKNNFAYDKIAGTPDNCWLGITITGEEPMHIKLTRIKHLIKNTEAKVKFISFEPLLGDVAYQVPKELDWMIVGGLTGHQYKLNKKYLENLMIIADHFQIPMFIKDNIKWPIRIQNYPDESA